MEFTFASPVFAGRSSPELLGDLERHLQRSARITSRSIDAGRSAQLVSEELRRILEEHDLLLVFAQGHEPGHSLAYPLYHLPGSVARFDNHTDAQQTDYRFPVRNSYVFHAVANGLKKPEEIEHYGVKSKTPVVGILKGMREPTRARIFDIDADFFHESYGILHPDAKSDGHPEDIIEKLHSAVPQVVGFFELNPHNQFEPGAVDVLKRIFFEAVEAVKKRRRPKGQ